MVNTTRKCGFRDCQNQIKKQEGYGWQNVCNNCLTKRQWASQCDACSSVNSEEKNFSIINDISDVNTGENRVEKAVKSVKKNIDYQKEVIQKFLAKNISIELRRKLNLAFQKCRELEKIIPELENLAQECEKKYQTCRGEFVREKKGQQFNIYEYCLCIDCCKEIAEREERIKNDYQTKGLNKLSVLNEETFSWVTAEIGSKEAEKIIWTSGDVEYTEEEFEKHYKEMKERLEKILKEEINGLSPSQIKHLEQRLKLYNEWENKSSKVIQESEKVNSADNKKDVKQLFWIFGIIGIIFIGLVGYFAYRNRKKIKNWQRK